MKLQKALELVDQAVGLLSQIPEKLYPGFDEEITKAFIALDDAIAIIKDSADYARELEAESAQDGIPFD